MKSAELPQLVVVFVDTSSAQNFPQFWSPMTNFLYLLHLSSCLQFLLHMRFQDWYQQQPLVAEQKLNWFKELSYIYFAFEKMINYSQDEHLRRTLKNLSVLNELLSSTYLLFPQSTSQALPQSSSKYLIFFCNEPQIGGHQILGAHPRSSPNHVQLNQ